jgi:hypothetical protein
MSTPLAAPLPLGRRSEKSGPASTKKRSAAEADLTSVDVGSMKVVELRMELGRRELSTAGLKKTLIARLNTAVEGN